MKIKLPRFFQFENYEVVDIKEFLDSGFIEVHLNRDKAKSFHCHRCGTELEGSRGSHFMRVEGLSIMGYRLYICFRRYKKHCSTCKKARSEEVSFISALTPHLTKELAWWTGRLCEISTVRKTAEFCGQNKSTVWRVDYNRMMLMLSHYRIPKVQKISVDEVYARKFSKYPMESKEKRYFTVITDIETRKVIWVSEGRSKAALDQFFILLGKEACEHIEVVAMDQFDGYKASAKAHCPNAVVVWDRFHLVKSFEELVNEERLTLHQRTDKQMPEKKLTRSKYKYIFMKKASRRTHKEEQHIKYVMKQNSSFYLLELIKERFLTMFDEPNHQEAKKVWDQLGEWIHQSKFTLLRRWHIQLSKGWETVENYFKYRVTTAISEGINNVIKSVKRRAFGFKNMDYFRLKIMQICGYLNSRFIPSQDQLLTQI